MTQPELQQLLSAFTAERVALLERHEAGARVVSHYDFNNTYQYVIAREETHITWLQSALADYNAPLPPAAAAVALPEVNKGKKGEPGVYKGILDDDGRTLSAFVERWREPVAALTHARHRLMLEVILGESREHQRLFEQAAAGMEDVLGKRTTGSERQGAVLSTRWME